MNILFLNRTFYAPYTGGVANSIFHLSNYYISKGFNVYVISENTGSSMLQYDNEGLITIIRHPHYFKYLKPRENYLFIKWLTKFIEAEILRNKIDIVISRNLLYSYCLLKVDVPKIYYLPSLFPLESIEFMNNKDISIVKKIFLFLQSRLQLHLEKTVIAKFSRIATLSEMRKKELIDYYGINISNISVIPPGVNKDKFKNTNPNKNILNNFNINQNDPILLNVNRQEYRKNLDYLIYEIVKVKKIIPNIRLFMIGIGSQHDHLKLLARNFNLESNIIFLGQVEDVSKWYKVADYFVFPTKQEGFGQVILEAMASGLPSILFKNVKGFTQVPFEEFITNNYNGMLVDPREECSFSKCIIKLFSNKDLQKTLSENCIDEIDKFFDWSVTANNLINCAISH